MKNPYEILGIHEGASKEEIKAAYLTLVKKYHPDKYQNNPLADLAQEKLQEVNEAYDSLTKQQGQQNSASYGNQSQGNYGNTAYNQRSVTPESMEVRRLLQARQFAAAEAALGRMHTGSAEWYFLSGMLSYYKGWYDDALGKIQAAASMEPTNLEYRQALTNLSMNSTVFRTGARNQGYNGNDDMLCKMLQCYMCTDCLCPCF